MFGFDEKKKRILTISFFVYAIVLLLAIIMMNFEKFTTFTNWLNDKVAIFLPIIMGAIIAYLCTPLVKFFQRVVLKKMKRNPLKRGLSILLAYISLLTLIVVVCFLIVPQLINSIEDLVRKMTDGTYLNFALDTVNNFLNKFLVTEGERLDIIDVNKINNFVTNFFVSSEDILQQGINIAINYASKIFTGVKNLLLGILISIYFVIRKENLYAQSKKIVTALFTEKKCSSIFSWCKFADKTFGGFVIGKILDALFMIFACSIAFSIAKIPYAILVSVVIGICNIIPFFGPFIGAIPCGLIILLADPGKLLLYIILLLIIQQFDANVVEPKIVGDRTGLSSLGVIVAIMIMSGYFGIIGMFFGVPIFAIFYTFIMSVIDKKLEKKAASTDIADYYSETSIVDPRRVPEPKSSKLYQKLGKIAVNSVGSFSKKSKNKTAEENTSVNNEENNENN